MNENYKIMSKFIKDISGETPDQARVLDKKIMKCWGDHKNQAIIRNGRPFKEKIEEATGKVIGMIDRM